MEIEAIETIEDHRFLKFQSVRDSSLRKNHEIIIDSARVVLRYLKLGLPLQAIIAPRRFLEDHSHLLSQNPGAQIFTASKDILASIVGYRIHSGVIAIGQRPKDVSFDDLHNRVIFLNGVNNSENIGAIVRNGLAFGAQTIVADPYSCSPFVRRSIRVSMGAVFKCKVLHCSDGHETLQQLKQLGYTIYAAQLSEKSIDLRSIVAIPKKCVLVIGREGDGIDPKIAALADESIHIAMNDGIDSLNAAVATGILLHYLR